MVLVDAAQSRRTSGSTCGRSGATSGFSGHKMLGPMGTGVLWGKRAPDRRDGTLQGGSNMAHDVEDHARFEHGALKYQAGTPNVSGAVGLAAAIDTLDRFDLAAIRRHDAELVRHFRRRMAEVQGLRVLGTLDDEGARLPVFTFTMPGTDTARIVKSLDDRGIAVRAGDMAALPPAAVRRHRGCASLVLPLHHHGRHRSAD